MFNFIKKWCKDLNEVQTELNKQGIFMAYHHYGAAVHYIDPKISDHINTSHDKQETISKRNSGSEGHRKV
tara:strand:+ start:380 stop:589 length:210 start_codon:yes stop_codon:yes gene_type:complete